jgi:kumamolisin
MSKQPTHKLLVQPLLAALFLSVSPGAVYAAQSLATQPGAVISKPRANLPAILTPASGQVKPGFAHTNIKVVNWEKPIPAGVRPQAGPPAPGYLYETPASLACIYGFVAQSNGCNPNSVTTVTSGGSKAIAIVDAFDYPSAESDLNTFISQFGLAPANFQVIYGTGSPTACPAARTGTAPTASASGWDLEAALDIEMAHAIAPGAKLYLVEAASSSFTDMMNAEAVATACVQSAGGGEVSNSWGAPEWSGETALDSYFTGAGVAYFASSGDTAGVEYPASSPNVFGVGGTTISRDQTTGAYQSQSTWNDWAYGWGTGGGPSAYEAIPSYQSGIAAIVGNKRGTPDLAMVADPLSGVWVFNSYSQGGWVSLGGTSVAAPLVTAVINRASFFWASSFNGLNNIYNLASQGKLVGTYTTDINNGLCGPAGAAGGFGNGYDPQFIEYNTNIAWDWCTGWGSPRGSHAAHF